MDSLEKRAKKTWPRVLNIAREAKERTKSELSIGEILMLYGIVSVPCGEIDSMYIYAGDGG